MISSQPPHLDCVASESLDGYGAADHDQPYRFGHRPRSSGTYPFSTREFTRLLVLRSRFQAGEMGADDVR